jgi:hypothetical protein
VKSSRALLLAVPVATLAALAGCSSSSSPAATASASAVTSPVASPSAAPPTGTAAVSGTAQPTGTTVYFAESGTVTGPALFEPGCGGTGCLLTGDSTAALFNMTWTAWGATEAVGSGTEKLDNCTPNCASGKMEAVKVTVTFSKPVTETCAGSGTRMYWTRASFSWPDGLPADLSAGGGPANPMVYPGIGGDGSCG